MANGEVSHHTKNLNENELNGGSNKRQTKNNKKHKKKERRVGSLAIVSYRNSYPNRIALVDLASLSSLLSLSKKLKTRAPFRI
jgi:hypothetical protein